MMTSFDKQITKILKKYSYDFFVVQQNFDISCSCVNIASQEAKIDCPKCLGTGYKIKIKKIRGASNSKLANFVNSGPVETSTPAVYYVGGEYPLQEDNVIVDGNDVLFVYRVQPMTSTSKNVVFQKVMASIDRSSTKPFLDNFNKIVGR